MKNDEGKKLLSQFENTIEWAELRALSKHSLEHPLTDGQHARMMELGRKLGFPV